MCHSQEYCEKDNNNNGILLSWLFPYKKMFSIKCFVMFPSVNKLGNTLVRNIVSYQCFVMFPSVGKLDNIFVRNIVFYQSFAVFPSVGKLGNFIRNIARILKSPLVCLGLDPGKHLNVYNCVVYSLSRSPYPEMNASYPASCMLWESTT